MRLKMRNRFDNWFRQLPFYQTWRAHKKSRKEMRQVRKWEKEGRPEPPPQYIKRRNLIAHAQMYGLRVFVETGTFRGDTVEAMKSHFERIYSIELCSQLFCNAKERFKKDDHVEIIQGDSGVEIENIMKKINQPALFWLDGHYSAGNTARGEKDTPIMEELGCILNSEIAEHVIVIDDARCFGTDPSYPKLDQLKEYILSKKPAAQIRIEDDGIVVTLSDREVR
jgi:hypothetical protein